VNDIGSVFVLLTASNTIKPLHSFSGFIFQSPSGLMALNSFDMELYLTSSNGTLFRMELSAINVDNGTSFNSSGLIDQYQMPSLGSASLLIDQCYRLWVLSSPANPKAQMFSFTRQNNSNKSFSAMTIVNYTNSLPNFG
jgi:hypothetical protein